jgi:pimeloyl-ACP methyl ester carboxylesterase
MAAIKGENTSDYTLPPPDKKALQAWEIIKKLPNSTREEKIEIELENLKLFSGIEGFDEKELRGLAEKLVDRTRDFEARYHHRQAMNAASSRIERLRNVHVPTLVIHGGNDAVFPVAHGVATAQAIPNAKLVIIPAMGHVVCKHFEDQLVSLITEFHECPIANERSRAISF